MASPPETRSISAMRCCGLISVSEVEGTSGNCSFQPRIWVHQARRAAALRSPRVGFISAANLLSFSSTVGEYTLAVGSYVIDVRMGVNYETSAIPNAYLSPLTIDMDKVTLGIGGGLHIGEHLRLDGVYAHVFTGSATVSPSEAAVPPTAARHRAGHG